ncbi:MAG: pyruvate dehydrogenase complex dihydrolipoamide acetyltransferase [Bacteroidia bacterium]|nr:pyruvate dehydrogenase complex dihydrolipoamide acetyltransferase [Bacteroidia bacterium]
MAEAVTMPKMSDTMSEGVVSKWIKKVGDKIETGDVVAEIETDKATMEFESYQEGTLLYIGVEEGKAAPVDGLLAILGEKGEDFSAILKEFEEKQKAAEANPEEEKVEEPKKQEVVEKKVEAVKATAEAPAAKPSRTVPSGPTLDIKASPLARRLADERGIDLNKIIGTGEGGRVVKRDIDWFKPSSFVGGGSNGHVTQESFEELPVSQMRKTIARRLAESKFDAPHFYLTIDIDMENAVSARAAINNVAPTKISFNDLIVKAVSISLRMHPKVNSSWLGDTIRMNKHINIGVAVAVDEGLLVPVIRYADSKTLSQISEETRDYVVRAKEKKLQPADWEGNTFTISNLGMFNIEEFTAIINPPDACIMAIGAIKDVPVVRSGEIVPGKVMRVTLSCDHRVVDGLTGAEFLNTFKSFLEDPVLFLGRSEI